LLQIVRHLKLKEFEWIYLRGFYFILFIRIMTR
jgi:hypothetical protein